MSEPVKVTRAHREAATEALMLGVSDEILAYECTGAVCGDDSLAEAERVAQCIANAEARTAAAMLSAIDAARGAERRSVVEWLRTAPKAAGVLIDINASQCIARLASDIERGDHVRSAPAEGAGK